MEFSAASSIGTTERRARINDSISQRRRHWGTPAVTVLQPRSTWSRTTRTSKKTAKPNHFRWRKTNPMIDLTLRKIDRADSMAAPALTHSPVPLLDVV